MGSISAYREPSDEPRILIQLWRIDDGLTLRNQCCNHRSLIAQVFRSIQQMLGRATRGPRAGGTNMPK